MELSEFSQLFIQRLIAATVLLIFGSNTHEVSEYSDDYRIQQVSPQMLADYFPGVRSVGILRIDLPEPVSGGNKRFKLKYNLEAIAAEANEGLLTFGGAYSNHIAATAYAGKVHGISTIGVIRGNELNSSSNAVLRFASGCGMKLHFVSRDEYRRRNDKEYISELRALFGNVNVVPEGGSNDLAVKGCMEILSDATDDYDVIVCPVGTGATLAGIIASAKSHQHTAGIAVLEGRDYLERLVNAHLKEQEQKATWEIDDSYTLGGYAKTSAELEKFIDDCDHRFNLPLDPVYSGKALFALHSLTKAGRFTGKRVLFVHTGGYAFYGKNNG